MIFKNRKDAGEKLAGLLSQYEGPEVMIFALPRGGVVLGFEIAKKLHAPLHLLITQKIGHPQNPEYAIASLAEDETVLYNPEEILTLNRQWLEMEIQKKRGEIRRRRKVYLGESSPTPVYGKTVIIVDDGIATGLTMFSAIKEIKRRQPKQLLVAVPIVPFHTAQILQSLTDRLISLNIDKDYLGAVGAYYEDFHQVSDEEVILLLQAAKLLLINPTDTKQ